MGSRPSKRTARIPPVPARDQARRALELAAPPANGVLVDLGSGAGATVGLALRMFPGLVAIGVDPQPIRPAPGHGASLLRTAAQRLPLRPKSADAVIAECALCLMEPRDEVLGEIRRVLRPGGRLVFSEFYTTEPLAWASPELARLACVHDAPNPDDMLRSLRAAGFAEASLEDHSDALHEIEDRVQRRVDVVGLLGTLASGHGDPLWSEASRFLGEARRRRDDGRLRYGIFRAVRG